MLKTYTEATDNMKDFRAKLKDLSKALNCLSQDLLTAKLHAYGLDLASLNHGLLYSNQWMTIYQDYSTKRKQRLVLQFLGKDTTRCTTRFYISSSFENHQFYWLCG